MNGGRDGTLGRAFLEPPMVDTIDFGLCYPLCQGSRYNEWCNLSTSPTSWIVTRPARHKRPPVIGISIDASLPPIKSSVTTREHKNMSFILGICGH